MKGQGGEGTAKGDGKNKLKGGKVKNSTKEKALASKEIDNKVGSRYLYTFYFLLVTIDVIRFSNVCFF